VVDEVERGKNRTKSGVRAKVEHPFGVIKRVFGFAKVRYRGLAKNTLRALGELRPRQSVYGSASAGPRLTGAVCPACLGRA